MPDDSLFNTPTPEGGAPETPETPATPEAPALTAEAVQAMINEQTVPLQTELAVTQERLAAANALNDTLSSQYRGPAPVPTPDLTSDQYIENFTNDALGATRQVAQDAVDKKVGALEPIFQRQNDSIHHSLVQAEKAKVEAEYGEGTWDIHFAPLMDARMAALRNTDALSMANPDVVSNEVLSIMGHKRHALDDVKIKRGEATKVAEEARYEQIRGELNMTGLTGGTTAPPMPIDAPLTDADKDFIESKRLAGQEVDIQKLRRGVQSGATSWTQWKADQPQEATK